MASLQSLVAAAPSHALKHELVSSSRLNAFPLSTALAVPRTARLKAARCQASEEASWPSSQRVSGSHFKLPAASSRREDVVIEARASASVDSPVEKQSTEKWVSWIMDVMGKALKPALVSILVAAVLWFTPGSDALAASTGGRAGGKSFSASRARSYSAPSQSYSRPSQGYSRTYIAPSPGYSAPFFMSPWGFSPFGFGPSIMIGGGGGGGGIFGFMIFSVMAYFVLSSILNFWGSSEEEVWEATQRSSVMRLQVRFLAAAVVFTVFALLKRGGLYWQQWLGVCCMFSSCSCEGGSQGGEPARLLHWECPSHVWSEGLRTSLSLHLAAL